MIKYHYGKRLPPDTVQTSLTIHLSFGRSFHNDQLGVQQEPQAAQSTRIQDSETFGGFYGKMGMSSRQPWGTSVILHTMQFCIMLYWSIFVRACSAGISPAITCHHLASPIIAIWHYAKGLIQGTAPHIVMELCRYSFSLETIREDHEILLPIG